MQCCICEVDQPDDSFQEGSPICRDCVSKLIKIYEVEYSPPVRHSRLQACLGLIAAVRERAIAAGELEDFEEYWVDSTPWNQILHLVYEELRRHDGIKEAVEFPEGAVL